MKILAIETSSAACSVALLIDGQIICRHEIAPMQQAKLLLPMLEQLLTAENIELKQLDAIAFGCGPGSFTGVRIATSVAQGLAYAAGIPLIPISSLAAIAQAAYQEWGWQRLIVAIDARINETYWGAYEVQANQQVKLIKKEQVGSPKDIQAPDGREWVGVGDAWRVYQAEITYKPVQIDFDCLPTASAILILASMRFVEGAVVPAREALPVYLRDDVAKKGNK
jgi:tRNA threonylcarbamoyladenosine biosynthesis protein TsaB